jgi:hypothetical protein
MGGWGGGAPIPQAESVFWFRFSLRGRASHHEERKKVHTELGEREMTNQEIEIRDRFAECALHGLLSSPPKVQVEAQEAATYLATASYMIADAMLLARKPKP